MTFLQAVNAVLRRLRETEVSSVADTAYSKLIGDFVNDAKRQVEDAWDWVQLRSTVQIATANGTYAYTLTGAGARFRVLRDRTNNGWAVFNDTQDYQLWKAYSGPWMTRQLNTNSQTNNDPQWFDINGNSSGDPIVNLWPIPASVQNINFDLVIPQDDFDLDGTDDSTTITVPATAVVLGAYALAISERGEDGGVSASEADMRFMNHLSDLIAKDVSNVPEEMTFSQD